MVDIDSIWFLCPQKSAVTSKLLKAKQENKTTDGELLRLYYDLVGNSPRK